jgi:hypothetical protein
MPKKPRLTQVVCSVTGPRSNPYTIIKRLIKGPGMDAAREVIKDEGDFLAARIQLNLFQQLLPMKELNPKYLQWKLRQEPPLDPRKLIATGEYVESIQARKKEGGDVVDVNVPDDVTHGPSGMTMRELARIHEYGQKSYKETGKGIPPRPHWRPSIRWWKKKRLQHTEREIDKYVSEQVFKKLTARSGTKKYTLKPTNKK